MIIDTTINCDMDVVRMLEAAAEESGRSRSEIIALILRRVMMEFSVLARDNRRVQYQERSTARTRKKVHVAVCNRDYEFFIDMRKLFKWSVSALVAYGARKHMDTLLKKLAEGLYDEYADNYPFNSYFIFNETIQGAVCWRIYWGKPQKTDLLIPNMRE
jgi:hypothetical protein